MTKPLDSYTLNINGVALDNLEAMIATIRPLVPESDTDTLETLDFLGEILDDARWADEVKAIRVGKL